MPTSVARDPFARGEYVRECHPNGTQRRECCWCGRSPTRLYTYTWHGDACTASWRSAQLFCNLGCFRHYHN